MNILIVDDEFTDRNALKLIMSGFGRCVMVDSGQKAVEQFIEAWKNWRPFDLIMLDIEMESSTGLQVLHDIRMLEKELQPHEGVRIIMVSSNAAKDVVLDCLRSGCNEFVVKPVDKHTIKEKLQNMGANIRVFSP